ncbi:MAG: tRNA (adenosine(37)-N6)-threonylcarbamoyltransferase complex dimerization subunit type 1 TsaB [Candidatus Limnocylindrales bacterium]
MGDLLLAIDTATSRAVLAVGSLADGTPRAMDAWPGGHAHAETILPRLATLLSTSGVRLDVIGGFVVGVGPGGFTGLRVGLATAKTLAHGLGRPIVGIGTAEGLAAAVGLHGPATVILPAGPRDRYLVPLGVGAAGPRLLAPAALEAWLADPANDRSSLVAVDLDDPAIPDEARRRGASALDGLAPAMLGLGAAALAGGRADDVAALVPAYVTLPRGIAPWQGGVAWSPDLR